MEINPNAKELNSIQFTINSILLDYFKESIKDIRSYLIRVNVLYQKKLLNI